MAARAERAAVRAATRALGGGSVDLAGAAAPTDAECYMCLGRGTDAAPLRRNCACRGGAGFAHIECLVRAAEHNVELWLECQTCKQRFFGDVKLQLAHARWERARNRAEGDDERLEAANVLAHALHSNGGREAAVPLYEEVLRAVRRKSGGDNNEDAFSLMMSLAITHREMDNPQKALPLVEEALRGRRALLGDGEDTMAALDLLGSVHYDMEEYDAVSA